MIDQAIKNWEERKHLIEAEFSKGIPQAYEDIVKTVISVISDDYEEWSEFYPDATRIHTIDDGHCQGTLLFIIPEKGYQPDKYYYVYVNYGSCSSCDTLERIMYDYSWEEDGGDEERGPNKRQVDDLMTLALHIVQGLKELK